MLRSGVVNLMEHLGNVEMMGSLRHVADVRTRS